MTTLKILNNLTPSEFLAEYWQKKPLLIKQAIPNFAGLLDPNDLAGLACEEDIQARIIQFKKNLWQVKQGPFDEKTFAKLPENDWTLLVQNVNHYLPEASKLLALFNFIPHARLDDLMVSYAPKGGSVGAHLDSYDVFLLQGSGKRRWQISTQTDHTLLEDAPLKILKRFIPEQEWVLEVGDMLYLPPQVAHWGVAETDDCMTYSIGFRAPKTQELIHEFLTHLQEQTYTEALYTDADLTVQNHPAEISANMVRKVSDMLKKITWDDETIGQFLGQYLTEPKPHVFFEPNKKMALEKFTNHLASHNIQLSLNTQMLFWQQQFFINGEAMQTDPSCMPFFQQLANVRVIATSALMPELITKLAANLYHYYLAGYLIFED